MLNLFNKVIVAECNQGQKKSGVEKGGHYICNELSIKPNMVIEHKYFDNINSLTDNGYQMTSQILQDYNDHEYKTMLIGGDHSLGISSIDAFLNIYKDKLSILWIDAHADINDHQTSLSGNIHGMPLGYHHELRLDKPVWQTKPTKLKSSQLYYYGIRDLDIEEQNLIDSEDIKYSLTIDDNLLDFINKSEYLLISFDVDSLDPNYLDSTGCYSPNGISPSEVKYIINYAAQKNKLVHLDIMEFNPDMGDCKKSMEAIKQILL